MCDGLVELELAPSPKLQLRDTIEPSESELESEKLAVRSLVDAVKYAVGAVSWAVVLAWLGLGGRLVADR